MQYKYSKNKFRRDKNKLKINTLILKTKILLLKIMIRYLKIKLFFLKIIGTKMTQMLANTNTNKIKTWYTKTLYKSTTIK